MNPYICLLDLNFSNLNVCEIFSWKARTVIFWYVVDHGPVIIFISWNRSTFRRTSTATEKRPEIWHPPMTFFYKILNVRKIFSWKATTVIFGHVLDDGSVMSFTKLHSSPFSRLGTATEKLTSMNDGFLQKFKCT